MKFEPKNPMREFEVGIDKKVIIRDCGTMHLQPDEQITFITDARNEYDVTRKDWGFYTTPSLNGRLKKFALRAVLVKNREDRFFVLLVEKGKEGLFQKYIDSESLKIICWMDSLESLKKLEERLE